MAETKAVEKKLTPEQAHTKLVLNFYKKMPKPTAQRLHEIGKRIRLIGIQGTKAVLACGKHFAEAQQLFSQKSMQKQGKGTFDRWLKLEGLGVSRATAYNWIRYYEYARRFGTELIGRLGVRMLTGASGKVVAQRLLKAGELSDTERSRLVDEIKRESRSTGQTRSAKKKLLTKSVKAVFNAVRRDVHTIVTARLTDADAQARAVVSLCRDLLKDAGIAREYRVERTSAQAAESES